MYPDKSLWQNKKAMMSFQQELVQWFQKYSLNVTAQEPQMIQRQSPENTHIFCMTRLAVAKNSIAHPIGSPDAEFRNKLMAFLTTSATPPKDIKTVEAELSRLLLSVIETEWKANQVIYDPKSFVYVHEAALMEWKTLPTSKVLQFTFTIPEGDLVFELPIMTAEEQFELCLTSTGLSPKSRILIVDDSATSRKITRHFLSLAGFTQFDECEDGKAALIKIKGAIPTFEMVMADWHMPNMTGLELLKNIRQDINHKKTKIIFATGEKNGDEVKNALKEGVNGYLLKPIDPVSMIKAIKRACAATTPQVNKKAG